MTRYCLWYIYYKALFYDYNSIRIINLAPYILNKRATRERYSFTFVTIFRFIAQFGSTASSFLSNAVYSFRYSFT